MFRDNIYQKCALLGALRALCIHLTYEAAYSDDESSADPTLEELSDHIDGFLAVASTIGIQVEPSTIFSKLARLDEIISPIVETVLVEDKISEAINEAYGTKYRFAFDITQFLFLTRMFSDICSFIPSGRAPAHRKPWVSREVSEGRNFIKSFGVFVVDNKEATEHTFGSNYAKSLLELARIISSGNSSKAWARRVHAPTESLVNQLVPHYPDIQDRMKRSRALRRELQGCKPGMEGWAEYENICLKILRYLFLPPLKEVKVQARSSGNLERRDAIIPNYQQSGFWHLIHNEFDSRHVVCEFKNSSSGGHKGSLNQLRIYLSKPTIGRFGLLFVRKSPSKALLQAQRDAYEQSRIMILILDDQKLVRLMNARAYLGEADDFLHDEKIAFEINY